MIQPVNLPLLFVISLTTTFPSAPPLDLVSTRLGYSLSNHEIISPSEMLPNIDDALRTALGQVTPKSKTINSIDIKQNISLFKGQEMGRFKLGSTAIVLLPANKAKWKTNLMNGSVVRMGQTLGEFNN